MIRQFFLAGLVATSAFCPAAAEESADLRALLGRQMMVEGKYGEAYAVAKILAEEGVPRAQNLLGYLYDIGGGVEADPALAVEWYQKAADQGHAPAQFNLANIHALGELGLPQDPVKARALYAQAAAQDYQPALNNLAQMYFNGEGGEKNEKVARALLERGVSLGNKDAIANLAYRLAVGDGTEVNLERARELYLIAAAYQIPWAMRDYGEMQELGEGGPVDLAKAEEWYRLATGQGNAMAAYDMAEMIWANAATMPDRQVEALAWCFRAESMSPDAETNDYTGACDDPAAKMSAEAVAEARAMPL